jgi:hypothetical protein
MTAKTSGDSTRGVSGIIFGRIQDSFTTQGLARHIRSPDSDPHSRVNRRSSSGPLDNDYEIGPCRPDPQQDPARNQADAEREAELEFQLSS